jgi:DNA-binding SARP family transcriptional activator
MWRQRFIKTRKAGYTARMSGYKLTLFGGFNLTDDNGEAVSLRAKKARAAFIYLAVQGGRAILRDRLSFLLWGDSSESQARHSLRQALADIRKVVGAESGVIVSEGEEVRIDPQRIDVDASAFESLARSSDIGEIEQAIDLYQGELVEGFFSREEEYDDWLDAERQRLKTLALEVMTRFLDQLPASKSGEYRFDLARRILAIDPLDENAQCRIIEHHAAQQQPHLAIRQFERYRDSLQKELGIEPGTQVVETINRLRKHSATPIQIDTGLAAESTEVYKNLTVLCLYICGLPSLESPNAERFGKRLEEINQSIQSLVEAHHGQVFGCLANQVIAIFDTRRINYNIDLAALQAALECRQVLQQGFALDLKAAVTSGQLVLQSTHREQTLSSPVVIEAIELIQRGRSGDILLSQAVHDRCQVHARFGRIDESDTEVYRLDEIARSTAAAEEAFIGRRMECAQFGAALDSLDQWRSGQVILVRGDAGIGKSMLCWRFHAMLEQEDTPDIDWWSFELTPARRSVNDLLAALLDTIVGEAGLEPSSLTLERMREFCTANELDQANAEALLDLLKPKSAATIAAEKIEDQQRIQQQAVFQLVQRGLDAKPCCLLIEDIHLAESGLMDAIAQLGNLTASRSLLLLLSARSDGEALDPAWRGQFLAAQLTLMELNVFNQQEARQLAAGFTEINEEFRERCLQRAQGHPLFLEQLLSNADDAAEALPDSIRKSIQFHLDRLDIKLQHVALTLALAGPDIDRSLLDFLQIDQASVDSLLKEQILVRRDERLAFCHQLLHEVVVQNTLPSRALTLHEKLAQYYKLRDARRYAEHLIHTDAENRAEVMLKSVEQQIETGCYEEAGRLTELARSLLDEHASRRFALPQIRVLHRLGQNRHALQLCKQYLQTCGQPRERCLLFIEQGRIELLIEQLGEARDSLQQALELVDQHDLDEPVAETYLLLGNVAFSANQLQTCLQHQQQALEHAQRSHNQELVRQALGGLGDAYYSMGRMTTAAGYYQQAVDNDSPGSIQAGNRAMLAYCQIFMLEMEQAAHNSAASIRQAERFYDLRGEALARNIECIRLIESGEYHEAIRQGEKALAIAEKLGATRFILDNLAQLAHAAIRLGEIGRAQQMLEKAWQLCQPDLQGFMGASVAVYMAQTCLGDEQREWLEKGERLLTDDALSHNHLVFYHKVIELSLANQDTEQARHYAERLRQYTGKEPLPWADAAIRRAIR